MKRPKTKAPEEVRDALGSEDRGRERYPDYHYLWHLAAIGVIELDEADRITSVIWADEALSGDEPAVVALIDTGVADHPNLRNRVLWEKAVDFGSRLSGAFYRQGMPAEVGSGEEIRDLPSFDATIERLALGEREAELREFLARRTARGARTRDIGAMDQRYPSHGTAAAGLAVGTPLVREGAFDDEAFPYFGVDPWSRILPIATSFEPEPGQLILALVYALACGADIILMPRGVEHPGRLRPERLPGVVRPTRYDALAAEWDLFETVILAASKEVPIVCPAGNSGDSSIEYPANLADDDNGIISVGAVTPVGRRSGYSCYGPEMTVVAPSNDVPVYTRHQMRLDPQAPEALDHDWLIHDYPTDAHVQYSHEAPLSIDIPGPWGYASGRARRPINASAEVESLYTLFGGTSAASCIVAGVLALMRRSMLARGTASDWDGLGPKKAVSASAAREIFGNALEVDCSNAGDHGKGKSLSAEIFGAGLVSARAALKHF